jgi:hypothetical protein
MPDDTKVAALYARLEAIVKKAEDTTSRPPASSSRRRSSMPTPWSR